MGIGPRYLRQQLPAEQVLHWRVRIVKDLMSRAVLASIYKADTSCSAMSP